MSSEQMSSTNVRAMSFELMSIEQKSLVQLRTKSIEENLVTNVGAMSFELMWSEQKSIAQLGAKMYLN